MAMRMTGRHVTEDGAGMAREVVADLLHDTSPADLAGYVIVGLLADGGFKIASNTRDDLAEIAVVRQVLAALEAAVAGHAGPVPDGAGYRDRGDWAGDGPW